MNIFYLDEDIKKCAEYHCDKHIVKMLLEYTQQLCSTYYFTSESELSPYKLAHKSHPCCVWVRESLSNWLWLKELGIALYEEYKYRYNNKIHKAGEILLSLKTPSLTDKGITKRPQAMPLQYKELCPIKAYRNYYIGDKQHILKYTKRNIPNWLNTIDKY